MSTAQLILSTNTQFFFSRFSRHQVFASRQKSKTQSPKYPYSSHIIIIKKKIYISHCFPSERISSQSTAPTYPIPQCIICSVFSRAAFFSGISQIYTAHVCNAAHYILLSLSLSLFFPRDRVKSAQSAAHSSFYFPARDSSRARTATDIAEKE